MIAQVPDPTSALPGWLAGGGLSAIMLWLLVRAEKHVDEVTKDCNARVETANQRTDAAEQRYRDMVERNADKLYSAVAELGRATEAIQRLQNRGKSA